MASILRRTIIEPVEAITSGVALGPALIALALIDSLSVGTLAVPIWLLLAPGRVRSARILTYLGSLAAFYFVIGLVLLGGAGVVIGNFDIDWSGTGARRLLFFVGAALLAASFIVHPPGAGSGERHGSKRLRRWRAAATGTADNGSSTVAVADRQARTAQLTPARTLTGLALAVGLVEVGTMIPYLAAIGLLTSSEQAGPTKVLMLGGYCLVMITPAIAIMLGRKLAASVLDPLLRRLDRWFDEHGGETVGWILGIVGVILMSRNLNAVLALFESA